MLRKFIKYPSGYIKASIDPADYVINGFTPEEYERLKADIASQDWIGDNTYGAIYYKDKSYAIDIIAQDEPDEFVPVYNIFKLNDGPENDWVTGGIMSLGLTYEEQIDFLILMLECAIDDVQ